MTKPAVQPKRILSCLAISGFLLAMPGGLLPLWGYHMKPEFGTAANYFAILGGGITVGSWLARRVRERYPVERILAGGCFAGALALLLLSLAAPPASVWYQYFDLLVAGMAVGCINTAIFESLASVWEANPAGTTLAAGIYFGSGSALAAWILAQCVESGNATRWIAMVALAPAAAGFLFGRNALGGHIRPPLPVGQAMKDLRSVMAIMFALLLFFQFSNEWSLAGWLPVFLIDRLGLSPRSGVMLLCLYWIALTAGRVIVARLLPFVRHGRLLAFSAFCGLFGCTALLAAGTYAGVVVGILLTGAGFSAIYPLAAERIATRFSYYHPGYFNGIFTLAILGGSLSPFVLGHVAAMAGLRIVPLAVMAGSCAVFVLVLLIWLGRKVSGS